MDFVQKNLETSSFLTTDQQRLKTKPLVFLIVLDGDTSHLTAYPCKSTSPSKVQVVAVDWIFFDIYLGVVWTLSKKFCVIFF